MLENEGVEILANGYICVNDLIPKFIDLKYHYSRYVSNEEICIEYHDGKRTGRGFISFEYFLKWITSSTKSNSDIRNMCKGYMREHPTNIILIEKIIDPINKIFKYNDHVFPSYFHTTDNNSWDIWINGLNAIRYLEYKNNSDVMNDHVKNCNKSTLAELRKIYPDIDKANIGATQGKCIFITMEGFFNLVHMSKKPMANELKSWIDNEIMPSIIKTGKYIAKKEPLKPLVVKNFFSNESHHLYDKKNVVYIGYVGIVDNEYIFKYGKTKDIHRRVNNEHKKNFNEFTVLYVGICDANEYVEEQLRKQLINIELHRVKTIKNIRQTELFTESPEHTHQSIIEILKNIIVYTNAKKTPESTTRVKVTTVTQEDPIQLEIEIAKIKANADKESQIAIAKVKAKVKYEYKMKELENEKIVALAKINADVTVSRNKTISNAIKKGLSINEIANIIDKPLKIKK